VSGAAASGCVGIRATRRARPRGIIDGMNPSGHRNNRPTGAPSLQWRDTRVPAGCPLAARSAFRYLLSATGLANRCSVVLVSLSTNRSFAKLSRLTRHKLSDSCDARLPYTHKCVASRRSTILANMLLSRRVFPLSQPHLLTTGCLFQTFPVI